MTTAQPDPASIDAALQQWCQGDTIFGSGLAFVHVADLARPVSAEAKEQAGAMAAAGEKAGGTTLLESEVEGFVVITQTCDVVREAEKRPYVELAPLVEVSEADLAAIEGLQRPAFAFVPALAAKRLVADLDRTMTIEKSVLVAQPRQPGVTTDAEVRAFALALARKRSRFAFPNTFVDLVRLLQKRIVARYGKTSEEGLHVSALSEIRVAASPSWSAEPAEIFFLVREAERPR